MIQSIHPIKIIGFIIISLAGGIALFCAIMSFVFGISFIAQHFSFGLNLSAEITQYLMAASAFISLWGAFVICCRLRYNLS
jgi:hypothetical protein